MFRIYIRLFRKQRYLHPTKHEPTFGILKGIQNTTTNFYSTFKPEIEYIAPAIMSEEQQSI